MTPEQERAVLQDTELGIEKELEAAYEKLVALIVAGVLVRDAVQQVMDRFMPKYAELLSVAFSGVMAQAVGKEAAMSMQVGTVQLSQKLYAQAAYVSEVTTGIVDRHLKGFQDARALALELFEGYGFRPPDAEPLQLKPSNTALPKYLREALLPDGGIQSDLARAFAKMQVDNLRTPALKAAYSDVLRAISDVESGKGADLLEKRLRTAFYERMRYFANRIAQTELHRAYSLHVAKLIMDDEDIEFVQIQRSPGSTSVCICSLIAGRDKYGMGKGVYPKRAAPVPAFHPFCLPGDALITSAVGISAVIRRWYDGDMAVITTASGKSLTATVNHPILTGRGWIGAGFVNVGDDVVSRPDVESVRWYSFIDDDHKHMPTSIAEIADSFFRSGKVTARKVPVSAEDFHGDGMAGQIAVIGADGKLWDGVDAALLEVGADHFLNVTHAGHAGLLGNGILDLGDEGLWCPAHGIMRSLGIGGSLLRSHLAGADEHLFAGGSFGDSGHHEPRINDISADIELGRQIQNGATGSVFLDNVINVEIKTYHGYVYNLETEQGHYTSNGIVTHNCRCKISPRLDLTGKQEKPVDENSDRYFLSQVGAPMAAQIMGSKDRADQAIRSGDALAVANSRVDPVHQIKAVAGPV